MRFKRFGTVAALALALAGCGNEGSSGNSSTGGETALKAIPAPQGGDWTEVVSQTPEGGFRMGNPDAPVKLVEYASLTCPHCRDFAATGVPQLVNTYVKSGQVSYEFRNFVLNSIDLAATVLARCQGPTPFFGLTEQVYAEQNNWTAKFQTISPDEQARLSALPQSQQVGGLARAGDLVSFFQMRGLPAAKAEACLADQGAVEQLVQIGQDATEKHQITGTPGFLINNEVVEGAASWETLEPAIKEALG